MTLLHPAPGVTRSVLGVAVTDGAVPPRWDAPAMDPRFCADERRVLVQHGDASVYVEDGCRVTFSVESSTDRLNYDYLVYALAARDLLHQQRRFTLHATLVVSPHGEAVAIAGPSMSGKSTTTIELMRRGWTFACDDIVEVSFTAGLPMAVPIARPIHLSDHAALLLGADPEIGRHLPGRGKRVYGIDGDLTPRRLSAVVRLRRAEQESVTHAVMEASSAIAELAWLCDPRQVCQLPEMRADYLTWTAGVLSAVPLHDLARPVEGDSVDEVADAVEACSTSVSYQTANAPRQNARS